MIEPGRATPYGGQTSFNVGMSQLSKYLRPKAGLDAPLPKGNLCAPVKREGGAHNHRQDQRAPAPKPHGTTTKTPVRTRNRGCGCERAAA